MSTIDRRSALRLIGTAPLAVGFGLSAEAVEEAHSHATKAVAAAAAKGAVYKPKFFSTHEWQTVRILVDLILPKDERSGSATDAGVPEFMDFIMIDPMEEERARERRQTIMRGGLAWIDRECRQRFGHGFVQCTAAEHTALLDAISYSKPDAVYEADDEESVLPREPRDRAQVRLRHGAAFFNSFRDLTASGFFSSKMGVKDIGYIGNTAWLWEGPPPQVLRKLGIEEEKA
jgi:hypothetical protein